MIALLFICVLSVFAIPTQIEGEILCNLCVGTIDKLKVLAEEKGVEAIQTYLDSLCAHVSGFLESLCESLVKFGADKLIELIENKVQSDIICQKISLC